MNRLREIRFKKGVRQTDFLKKVKIWPSKISMVEREIMAPTDREKRLICKVLGEPTSKVFPDE